MKVLDIAVKDIKQIGRDWKGALFLVVMPILFTVFFGVILGPLIAPPQKGDPRLPVGWINQDPDGAYSASLESLLAHSDAIRPVAIDLAAADQAAERLDKGELVAVVTLPSGFSQAVVDGQPARLEVIADQGTAAGQTAVKALDTLTGRLLGAVESAQLSAQAYQDQVGFADEDARQAFLKETFGDAIAAWNQPPLTVQVKQGIGEAATQDPAINVTGFTQSSAGMLVQFAIFGLINSSMILVLERKTHSLQRLLTTPVKRAEIIGGHILAMFLVVFAQELLLVLLGQLVFGVNYLRQPTAILLMMVSLAVWAASLGLLIGALAKKEDQVIVFCLIIMFAFSALGGAWFPLDVAGKAFATIGHLMPSAWAMDGYQNIVMRGLGFGSVLMPAGILLGYTAAFFALALWRFKFE